MATEKSKRIVLVVISLFAALLIVEGSIRLFAWGFYYLQERQNKAAVLLGDMRLNQTGEKYINRATKSDLLILCIGESTTGLGGSNSWPNQLQRILNNIQNENDTNEIRTY